MCGEGTFTIRKPIGRYLQHVATIQYPVMLELLDKSNNKQLNDEYERKYKSISVSFLSLY